MSYKIIRLKLENHQFWIIPFRITIKVSQTTTKKQKLIFYTKWKSFLNLTGSQTIARVQVVCKELRIAGYVLTAAAAVSGTGPVTNSCIFSALTVHEINPFIHDFT